MSDSTTPEIPDAPTNGSLAALEAILFAADRPLHADEIADIFARVDGLEPNTAMVERALYALGEELRVAQRGIDVAQVGGGWELRTHPNTAPYVAAMYRRKPVRLSRAALEVLAIIAYRQPCTRADIDDIRGVDSSSTIRPLLERGLVRILGKADDVGRPLIYGTSPAFLEFFGLNSLAELPTLKEYTDLSEEHVVALQELDETLRANLVSSESTPTEGAPTSEPPTS